MSSSLFTRRHTFRSSERIKSKKIAKELFEEGSSFFVYPFVVRHKLANISQAQVLISTPKKKLRRAVDRNLTKRRIREAYRINKFLLADFPSSNSIVFSLVYVAGKPLDFHLIEEKLKEVLVELKKEIVFLEQ
jgi:ribonuclease P protein component